MPKMFNTLAVKAVAALCFLNRFWRGEELKCYVRWNYDPTNPALDGARTTPRQVVVRTTMIPLVGELTHEIDTGEMEREAWGFKIYAIARHPELRVAVRIDKDDQRHTCVVLASDDAYERFIANGVGAAATA